MVFYYYNLDTPIESYFDNVRVINILHSNKINNLYDLVTCDINKVLNSNACGSKSRGIIQETFYYLKTLAEKRIDTNAIQKKYPYLLNDTIIISKNSDNNEFKNGISFAKFLEIYVAEKLTDRDLINANLILQFLDVYEGNKPLDYISQETSKFKSNKEAYDYLFEIINSLDEGKSTIYKRYNGIFEKKQTLEEIGKELGVTRERIRQINKRTTEKIYNSLDTIYKKVENTFNRDYYIPFDNPMLRIYCEYLNERGALFLERVFDEKVYVKNNKLITIVNKIEKIVEESNLYDEPLDSTILKLFEKKYLVKDGKILKNNTLVNYVPMVLEKIGRAVNLNSENDVNLIYDMLEHEYNVTTDYKDSRNIERVLTDTCILIDFRTYISEKFQKKTVISKIFDYIDKSEVTNAQIIYSSFTELWNDIDIYSHVGVYGYLKYFYPDKYNYAGRSFVISTIGKSTTWGEIVINMIKENHSPITFNAVNELYPALNNMIWINLEANFTDLIFWGDNSYYCASLLEISPEDMNYITIYIFNNGIVSDKDLYTYLLNNKEYIIHNNFLHSERQLLKFIKVKFNGVINYNSELRTYYI